MENESKQYHTIFLVHHLYYIPQFIPVAKELKRRNKEILFLLLGLDSPDKNQIAYSFCKENDFNPCFYDKNAPVFNCDFLINGAHAFPLIDINYKYTASIIHGIGTKAGYYTEEQNKHDIRFVEGEQRVKMIQELFPESKCQLFNVGFAKLDEAFSQDNAGKTEMLRSIELNPDKKTILYAPTFYPSSIENMPLNFPENFKDYNIIVKPHFFSFEKKKYNHQVKKFGEWQKFPNVYLAEADKFNLVPFMAVADIMLSDESSAIFEFAALNKPVILNQNVKYRLTYRIFKSKVKKRMDDSMNPFKAVAKTIHKYSELKQAISFELENPQNRENERKKISQQIVGTTDGQVSIRIVNILDNFSK